MIVKKNMLLKSLVSGIVVISMLLSQMSPLTDIVQAETQKAAIQQKFKDILASNSGDANGTSNTLNSTAPYGPTYTDSNIFADNADNNSNDATIGKSSAADDESNMVISKPSQTVAAASKYKGTRFIVRYKTTADQQNAQKKYSYDKRIKSVNSGIGDRIRKKSGPKHGAPSTAFGTDTYFVANANTSVAAAINDASSDTSDVSPADGTDHNQIPTDTVAQTPNDASDQGVLADALTLDADMNAASLESDLKSQGIAVDYVQPDYAMNVFLGENTSLAESFLSSAASSDSITPPTSTPPTTIAQPSTSSVAATPAPGSSVSQPTPASDWGNFYADLSNVQRISDGSGVTVALLDSGVETTHPAIADNIDPNGYDFFNDNSVVNDTSIPYDQGHSTFLAGIIAGKNGPDNSLGSSSSFQGTASGARILPLKIFQGGIAYTSDIIGAITYADSMGVKIANCSWGNTNYNQALKDAMADSSMLFVCAAGNSGSNIDKYPVYPASFDLPNVISVSAVDSDGIACRFSNYGPQSIDVSAPGINITGPGTGGGYVTNSGTSASAAFVSGVAALILCKDDTLTASQLKHRIIDSSDTVTGLENKVADGKRINIGMSVSDNYVNNNVIDIPDDFVLTDNAPYNL